MTSNIEILHGKEYCRAANPKRSKLQYQDIERCQQSINQWRVSPNIPSLKFERLGDNEKHNHCSIRASLELRVILAVEFESNRPKRAAVMNIGHHDRMYDWYRRQGFQTDLQDSAVVLQPGDPTMRNVSEKDPDLPPQNFEEWMLFPSPGQAKLIHRHHRGAARIRGAAGTGKTVIALRRADVLGRRYPDQRILVTTFSRSLCVHMKALFRRLPEPPDNVDFMNVDRLAARVLEPLPAVHSNLVDQAFRSAYAKTVPESLAQRVGEAYLREEVERVIK
ncbi:MAG: hypothetical protein OXD30_07230, partial [Bryobacterales bacterium]|nr:hypothetical protein [Bryobacterales bacterium]